MPQGECGAREDLTMTLVFMFPGQSSRYPGMLDKLREGYIASKMRMFNDVVHRQFGHLNGPAPKGK